MVKNSNVYLFADETKLIAMYRSTNQPNDHLNAAAYSIVPGATVLINQGFHHASYITKQTYHSKIIPFHKNGSTLHLINYRSINLIMTSG